MASQEQTVENGGEDFSKDVKIDQPKETVQEKASGEIEPSNDSGSADTPGKDDDKKLFVGGLSWETTDVELRNHFSKFGEIESVKLKKDALTRRSRGFAFIVFKDKEAIDKVTATSDHIINGKKCDAKKAMARQGKIFVGGLSPDITEEDIREHFTQFGKVIELEIPFDKQKNQRKAFCFVTFDTEAVISLIVKQPKQIIRKTEVDVKTATPRTDPCLLGGVRNRGGNWRGGRGGRNNSQGWNQGNYNNYGNYQGYVGYDNYGGGYDYYGSGYGNYSGYDYSGYGNYDQEHTDGGNGRNNFRGKDDYIDGNEFGGGGGDDIGIRGNGTGDLDGGMYQRKNLGRSRRSGGPKPRHQPY